MCPITFDLFLYQLKLVDKDILVLKVNLTSTILAHSEHGKSGLSGVFLYIYVMRYLSNLYFDILMSTYTF